METKNTIDKKNQLSPIRARIDQEIKTAMKSGDKFTLNTLRMVFAAIKQVEIDERKDLNDQEVTHIIKKCIKQRQESARQYTEVNRNELAEKELNEIKVIEIFLPAQISDEKLDMLIDEVIKETGANSMKQMGQVIGLLKQQTENRADMSKVSAKVKMRLNQ